MTQYDKYRIKRHLERFGIIYSLYGMMLVFVVLIGLEAKGII